MTVCHHAYERIIQAGDQISVIKSNLMFCREQYLNVSKRSTASETEVQLLHQRLHSIGSEMHAVSNSLAQQQQDCALLHNQLADLQSSLAEDYRASTYICRLSPISVCLD